MEFKKLGKPVDNLAISIAPWDFAKNTIVGNLDIKLGYLKEKRLEILQEFIEKTTERLQSLTKSNHLKDCNETLKVHIKDYEYLNDYLDFFKIHLNLFMETLQVTEIELWDNKEIEFPDTFFFQSVNKIYYNQVLVLIDILGKNDAFKLYRETVKAYNQKYDIDQKNIFSDLEDMQVRISKSLENNNLGRVRLFSNVEDGKQIKICLNCDKINGLRDSEFNDKEILYTIVCEPHFVITKNWNENFELTLEHTIGKGDVFCDYVYHDTSIVDKIEHPSKEFFDKVISEFDDS